jgi:uncharacterized protein (TIGR02246 family)
MTQDERAIRALIDDWLAASKKHDIRKVLRLIADDALFMTPGREPFGKDAFAEASEAMETVQFDGTSEIQELQIAGDWAWCSSRLHVEVTPPNGDTMRRSGYALTILRKNPQGDWQVTRDANLLS